MRHLKEWQRYQIAAKLEAGCTKKEIAEYLGVHPSTITREIQRNGYSRYRCYKPRIAQERAAHRWRCRHLHLAYYNILIEVGLQIVHSGNFAHRLAHTGDNEVTEDVIVYCIEPYPVVNAAQNGLWHVEKGPVYVREHVLVFGTGLFCRMQDCLGYHHKQ